MRTLEAVGKEANNLVNGAMSLDCKLKYLDEAVIVVELKR